MTMQYGDMWVFLTMLAILLTGVRGYYRKYQSLHHIHHQHIHLISTLTTTFLSIALILLFNSEYPDNFALFILACVANGAAYSVAVVCNYKANIHLKLSTFQSASNLSSFLPVVVFYFILDEKLSAVQVMAIMSAAFPLLILGLFEPETDANQNISRKLLLISVSYLIIYILITSAQQILNVIIVKNDYDFSLGVDPFLFIMISNAFSILISMGVMVAKKEKITLNRQTIFSGINIGVINLAAFASYLIALRSGPASIIVPMYSYSAFLSIALLTAFPFDKKIKNLKKQRFVMAFLTVWVLTSIVLMLRG